jgi:hypothetical protein
MLLVRLQEQKEPPTGKGGLGLRVSGFGFRI